MINVKSKTCIYNECNTIPVFNKEGETEGLYCSIHKKPGMVDVKNKYCIYPGCKIQCTFNKESKGKPLYCLIHKEPDMINVKNKYCIYPGCKTVSTIGYCGLSPSHCAKHKLNYMIIKPKKKCKGNDEEDCKGPWVLCKDIAIYGKDEPLHCEDHKLEGEICWLVKKCNNCGRDKELLNKDSLCGICADVPFYEESKRMKS